MLEGLLITVTGMAVVFLVLTILMFVIMGMERLFRDKEVSEDVAEETAVEKTGAEPHAVSDAVPDNTSEVAAITLALAFYLKQRGKRLGTPIAISGVQYQVEMGDSSRSPVNLVVNQDCYRAAIGEDGLSIVEQGQVGPETAVRAADNERGKG